jgi:hypothetical protein
MRQDPWSILLVLLLVVESGSGLDQPSHVLDWVEGDVQVAKLAQCKFIAYSGLNERGAIN